jgi:hypothetical protein
MLDIILIHNIFHHDPMNPIACMLLLEQCGWGLHGGTETAIDDHCGCFGTHRRETIASLF